PAGQRPAASSAHRARCPACTAAEVPRAPRRLRQSTAERRAIPEPPRSTAEASWAAAQEQRWAPAACWPPHSESASACSKVHCSRSAEPSPAVACCFASPVWWLLLSPVCLPRSRAGWRCLLPVDTAWSVSLRLRPARTARSRVSPAAEALREPSRALQAARVAPAAQVAPVHLPAVPVMTEYSASESAYSAVETLGW